MSLSALLKPSTKPGTLRATGAGVQTINILPADKTDCLSLYISYNSISSLKNINQFRHLNVLLMDYNNLEFIEDLEPLSSLKYLTVLHLEGNPLTRLPMWEVYALKQCPKLKILNGRNIAEFFDKKYSRNRLMQFVSLEGQFHESFVACKFMARVLKYKLRYMQVPWKAACQRVKLELFSDPDFAMKYSHKIRSQAIDNSKISAYFAFMKLKLVNKHRKVEDLLVQAGMKGQAVDDYSASVKILSLCSELDEFAKELENAKTIALNRIGDEDVSSRVTKKTYERQTQLQIQKTEVSELESESDVIVEEEEPRQKSMLDSLLQEADELNKSDELKNENITGNMTEMTEQELAVENEEGSASEVQDELESELDETVRSHLEEESKTQEEVAENIEEDSNEVVKEATDNSSAELEEESGISAPIQDESAIESTIEEEPFAFEKEIISAELDKMTLSKFAGLHSTRVDDDIAPETHHSEVQEEEDIEENPIAVAAEGHNLSSCACEYAQSDGDEEPQQLPNSEDELIEFRVADKLDAISSDSIEEQERRVQINISGVTLSQVVDDTEFDASKELIEATSEASEKIARNDLLSGSFSDFGRCDPETSQIASESIETADEASQGQHTAKIYCVFSDIASAFSFWKLSYKERQPGNDKLRELLMKRKEVDFLKEKIHERRQRNIQQNDAQTRQDRLKELTERHELMRMIDQQKIINKSLRDRKKQLQSETQSVSTFEPVSTRTLRTDSMFNTKQTTRVKHGDDWSTNYRMLLIKNKYC